jgi:hypothetical protein
MNDSQRDKDEKDLTAGPTPEVRRAEAHDADGEEVTEVPTPETREAERRGD